MPSCIQLFLGHHVPPCSTVNHKHLILLRCLVMLSENILFRRENPQRRGARSAKGNSKNADLRAKIGDFGLSAMVDVKVMALRNSISGQQQDMEDLKASKAR